MVTLQDSVDGEDVDVSLRAEPALRNESEERTGAELAAIAMLNAVSDVATVEHVERA